MAKKTLAERAAALDDFTVYGDPTDDIVMVKCDSCGDRRAVGNVVYIKTIIKWAERHSCE